MCSFFPGATFLKRFLEHIKFSRRLGCNKNTSNFPGEDVILLLGQIKFSRRTKSGTRTHIISGAMSNSGAYCKRPSATVYGEKHLIRISPSYKKQLWNNPITYLMQMHHIPPSTSVSYTHLTLPTICSV